MAGLVLIKEALPGILEHVNMYDLNYGQLLLLTVIQIVCVDMF